MNACDALRAFAPPALDLPAGLLDELAVAYAVGLRTYHTLDHVVEVARNHALVRTKIGWHQPKEAYLAVLFHDAVYVPGAKDNENRSAELARDRIAYYFPAGEIDLDRVEALIRLTAAHGQFGVGDVDTDAALFLDCDMAVLGSEPATFDAYDRGIAIEYSVLPKEVYEAGRRAFLERLLSTSRIFLSEFFHERLDACARDNLRRHVAPRAAEDHRR